MLAQHVDVGLDDGVGVEGAVGPGGGFRPPRAARCQSALEWDPLSASKGDPFDRRVLLVALAASELARVAETP